MVLGADVVICMTKLDFLKKIFLTNCGYYGPATGLFEFIGKIFINFFLDLSYSGSLYYFLYSHTNPKFGNKLVAEV